MIVFEENNSRYVQKGILTFNLWIKNVICESPNRMAVTIVH